MTFGTPTRRASAACSAICSASPCTGSTICGRTQRSMSSSSAWRGWPETCTRCVRSVITSTPRTISPLITRADRLFVAGNGARGEDHAVAAVEGDLRMIVARDARQRGARLALAAGAQRQHLVGRQIAVGFEAAEFLHAFEITGFARDLHDALHGAANDHDFAAAGARGIGHAAQARDVGGEGRDRDARGALLISSARHFATSASDGERPSRTALVESPTSASTPSSPTARNLASSVGGPSTGVGSIFQSPVCSTVPMGVRMISAWDSGIECATATYSTSNGPTVMRPPAGTMVTGISGAPGSPCRLASSNAAVNGVA